MKTQIDNKFQKLKIRVCQEVQNTHYKV